MNIYILTELDIDGIISNKYISKDLRLLLQKCSDEKLRSDDVWVKLRDRFEDRKRCLDVVYISDDVFVECIYPDVPSSWVATVDTELYYTYGEEVEI